MTRSQHLLEIVSEECAEVIQRVSKAKRFGLKEIQKSQKLTNSERIQYEFADLVGTYELLMEDGLVKWPKRSQILSKKAKVEKFLKYSKKIGTLNEN